MIVVVMGPAGAGKTTVGQALAAALGWPFHDADDFHPAANVARMAAGVALTDDDRAPWLAALAALVARYAAEGASAVLACSALRHAYRDQLVAAAPAAVRLVYLRAAPALLAERLAGRRGHYFGAGLLASQLAALEEPDAHEGAPVLVLDAAAPVERLVARVRDALAI